jgi:hypothetical protein
LRKPRPALLALTVLLLSGFAPATAPALAAAQPRGAAAVASGWTTYHHDSSRAGFDPAQPAFPAFGPPGAQWSTGTLDGSLYAEPVTLAGILYQATENNSIYALDETTGGQVWYAHIAGSVSNPASAVHCGNINPVGITGTPVIDPVAQVIYAVGLVAATSTADKYQLFALHLANGSPVTGYPIDITPAGLDPVYQTERAALGLSPDDLTVYVSFGGWAGDCRPYHPFVVGVPVGAHLGQAQMVYQPQTSTQTGGGIWAASGMAIDPSGNVYVATGNGFANSGTPCDNTKWDHGSAIIKLSPMLTELSSFAPSNWCALNAADQDLGSVGPLLLPNGLVFATGKSGDGWLLNAASLGGIGGALFSAHVSTCQTGNAIFGGLAYSAGYLYVPCDNVGLVALTVDTVNHTFAPAWKTAFTFTPTAPIVAGGVVWTTGNGQLYGLDAITGNTRFAVPIGGTTRFATPTEDNGWVFVPETNRVRGFAFSWQPLSGHLGSGPDAASWATGRLDVFARGVDEALWHRAANSGSWNEWETLGGIVRDDPGAVSGTPNRVDVFVRGADDGLWHRWWTGSAWSAWENLGGVLSAGPDPASSSATRIDVFARGGDNALWSRTWNGTSWQPWESLGGVLASSPGAVSWGAGQLDVFAQGGDGSLWHRSWNGTSWQAWEPLGGILSSAPDASSCAAGKLDVFALGADGGLWRKSFSGGSWGAWIGLGGKWTSAPSAVCQPGTTKIDLFERGTDGSLWTQELPS